MSGTIIELVLDSAIDIEVDAIADADPIDTESPLANVEGLAYHLLALAKLRRMVDEALETRHTPDEPLWIERIEDAVTSGRDTVAGVADNLADTLEAAADYESDTVDLRMSMFANDLCKYDEQS